MKTSILSHPKTEIAEKVSRLFYSFQVMVLGILIPFLFVFGITYHSQKELPESSSIRMTLPQQILTDHPTEKVIILSDQHS